MWMWSRGLLDLERRFFHTSSSRSHLFIVRSFGCAGLGFERETAMIGMPYKQTNKGVRTIENSRDSITRERERELNHPLRAGGAQSLLD